MKTTGGSAVEKKHRLVMTLPCVVDSDSYEKEGYTDVRAARLSHRSAKRDNATRLSFLCNERIFDIESREATKIAVRRPQLPDAMLDTNGSYARVMYLRPNDPGRFDGSLQFVPMPL